MLFIFLISFLNLLSLYLKLEFNLNIDIKYIIIIFGECFENVFENFRIIIKIIID